MSKRQRRRELIPEWNMPSDPVKAVFWFMHWLLRVLVRFFWIPILLMTLLESYLNWHAGGFANGIVGGVITLLVGIGIWLVLYMLLLIVNVSSGISRALADAARLQQNFPPQGPFSPFQETESRGRVVEGTITDLEEERRKRRQEL